MAQNRLLGKKKGGMTAVPPTDAASGGGASSSVEPNLATDGGKGETLPKQYPLVALYDCLHPFCLRVQLEVLKAQVRASFVIVS